MSPDDFSFLHAPHRRPDGRFFVPWAPFPHRLRDILRWRLRRWWKRERHPPDPALVESILDRTAREDLAGPRASWVGHATVVLEDGDDLVVLDPHWGPRALVPPRLRPARPTLESLPTPRFVVLSHDHYDHLDVSTVKRLTHVTWVVPLGLRSWLMRHGVETVYELDWWGSLQLGDWELCCLPAQHWSNRLEHRAFSTLWASWWLRGPSRTVYFGGDSGWFHGYRHFAELGRIDLAILPIGAFAPRWFMAWQHLDPAQAWAAFTALGARRLLPVHWGTFELADDHPDEAPLELLAPLSAAERQHLALLAVGAATSY
jgi:N-acyl-phosphatidylethanolamine-hydrolysing phospholipase D